METSGNFSTKGVPMFGDPEVALIIETQTFSKLQNFPKSWWSSKDALNLTNNCPKICFFIRLLFHSQFSCAASVTKWCKRPIFTQLTPTPSPFSPAPPSQLPRVSACVVAAPPAQVVTSLREWAAAPGAKDEETWHQTKVPKLRSNSSNSILVDSYHFFFIELGPVRYSLNYIWSSSYENFWTFQTASAKLLFALLGICCPLLSVNIPGPVEFGWKIRWFWHLGAFMESKTPTTSKTVGIPQRQSLDTMLWVLSICTQQKWLSGFQWHQHLGDVHVR